MSKDWRPCRGGGGEEGAVLTLYHLNNPGPLDSNSRSAPHAPSMMRFTAETVLTSATRVSAGPLGPPGWRN